MFVLALTCLQNKMQISDLSMLMSTEQKSVVWAAGLCAKLHVCECASALHKTGRKYNVAQFILALHLIVVKP